jgi:hypothetical protein
MRKHPLIALTAFTALTASAIAGAVTGSYQSNSMLTNARTPHHLSASEVREAKSITYGADLAFQVIGPARDLSVLHDAHRPAGLSLSSRTGLPISVRHARKAEPALPAVTEAPVSAEYAPATTTTTTTTTTAPPAPPATAPSGGVWYELRVCESGDNYGEDTGNGYYGAYQFSLSTWYGLGFTGLPSEASPATQDRAAEKLQAEAGWGQWPACSEELGL